MQSMSAYWKENITSSAREVKGKVGLYSGSTLLSVLTPDTNLSAIKIERTPTNGALFGYTIAQKATVTLIDKESAIIFANDSEYKCSLGVGGEFAESPTFYTKETKRDEVKGTLEVVGYDLMSKAAEHTLSEIEIVYPAEVLDYARAIASFLGTEAVVGTVENYHYPLYFEEDNKPNYDGTETLREVLEDIAEITGSVCFIDDRNRFVFKFLENSTVGDIGKSQYFTLETGEPIYITKVSLTTELGDNIGYGDNSGYNYVIHNNPFLEVHEEATTFIENLYGCVSANSYYPYKIKWRGDPSLEIGDCVWVETKSGSAPIFYLGETINYTGGMSATSEWQSKESPQVFTNPTNIGTAIKETYAKVDKVNKQISMVVSESEANKEAIAALQLNTDSINASVSNIEKATTDALEEMSEDVSTIKTKVDATMSADDVTLAIQKEIANGTSKVTTSTGFTFDEVGLTVSKTNSEMETTITEDGMRINRNDSEVLVANNVGVQATNLHAKTYLIIGNNSRFEDYTNKSGSARTGCFWIGG